MQRQAASPVKDLAIPEALIERCEGTVVLELFPNANKEPPTEFRIFPAGKYPTSKGEFTFDAESAKLVLEKYAEWGNDLSVDYEHAAVTKAGETGAPAAAWFKLEVRAGELWAIAVDWTERAKAYLKAREYRYFSPAFRHVKGKVVELINLALTNLPATKGMLPLVASIIAENPKGVAPMKTVLAALGLTENASESEALEIVERDKAARKAILTLTEMPNVPAALGVLELWKEKAAKHKELKKKMKKLLAASTAAAVVDAVEKAVSLGKLSPSQKEWAIDFGTQNFDALQVFLKTAPILPLSLRKLTEKKPASDVKHVDESDPALKLVASQLGMKPDTILKRMDERGTDDIVSEHLVTDKASA